MKINTFEAHGLKTLECFNDRLYDWNSAGTEYSENGEIRRTQKYHFGFTCDSSITSNNGKYSFIYKKLGTKGILLKDGNILREINRCLYQSEEYEYPACFFDYEGKLI